MALKNRQAGKVEIFVGTEKLVGYAKNVIEFDEIALKTDITSAVTTATGKQALLTALGIPGPYANDAAAKAASVPIGGVYYITTTLKLATVMS